MGVEVIPMELPSQLRDNKVLVTGASGFIGSHLSQRLCDNGYEVHSVSRTRRCDGMNRLHWWQRDLEDPAIVRDLVTTIKPAVIFHLTGQVTAAPGLELVSPTLCSLLVSTVNLLTAATEIGCHRVVLIGSLTEPSHNDAVPGSPYAAAKWASSVYGRMFHALYQTPVVIARPFMTYGPGQDMRKLIPYVTLSLLQGEVPKLSSGCWQADWIYIDDVVDGLLCAAQVHNVEGCMIDLGSGRLVTTYTVVQQLTNCIDSRVVPLFGAVPDRPLEEVRIADTAYAHAKLGWKPLISLENGLRLTVEWYKRQLKDAPTV